MRRSLVIVLGIGAAAIGFLVTRKESIVNLFSSRTEFVQRLWKAIGDAAIKSGLSEKIGTAQKTILIGQAVHESSWGVARAAKRAFNYWNLTAGSKWKGPTIPGSDLEYDKAGNVKKITQSFRAYSSDEEAARDMLRFIGPGTRYAKAWDALLKGDALAYAYELHSAGFFTQPLVLYQKGLAEGIKTVVQILG